MSRWILLRDGVAEFFYMLADFPSGRSIPAPHSAFSDVTPVGRFGVPSYRLARVEVYVFNLSFADGVGDGATFFFFLCLAEVKLLLPRILCLAGLPPFLVLWLETQPFWFGFGFCLHPLVLPDCRLFKLQLWDT